MNLSLYDTHTRIEQVISAQDNAVIKIYCCGPTVYRDAHIGNLRTFLLADLVVRVLHHLGKQTLVVQNITDVGHMTDDFEEDKFKTIELEEQKTKIQDEEKVVEIGIEKITIGTENNRITTKPKKKYIKKNVKDSDRKSTRLNSSHRT